MRETKAVAMIVGAAKHLLLTAAIVWITWPPLAQANEELRAILDRLDAREAAAKQTATAAPTPQPVKEPVAKPPSKPSTKSAPAPRTAPSSARSAQIDPKAKVYGTKDRLPRKIAGQPLAGEFFVLGEYIDGGTVLYAVEDEGKGLLRQYVVVNRTSGLAPGTYYDQGRRPKVIFTRQQPLIFVKKLFPGLYAVRAP
jgi:hypothetical protein